MGKVIVGMTVSLDGFVQDGAGGLAALYPDMEAMVASEAVQAAIRTTGAVVMGRRTFAMGDPDWYAGNYEFQVPIFVVTHTPPARLPKQDERLTFTFVTDGVESAIRQARAAAGARDVTVVGGADTIQQLLRARLADELHLSLRPVLLGEGLRLLENLGETPPRLEQIGAAAGPLVTELRYRVAG
jgi:dihydrofolate reductase